MVKVNSEDTVLFTNDLFLSRKIGKVKKVYLKGTCGESYKIESEGEAFSIGMMFIIAKI